MMAGLAETAYEGAAIFIVGCVVAWFVSIPAFASAFLLGAWIF
jgi:hypothetical protein